MQFFLQPGGGGRYFMFSNIQNNNTMYSVACSNIKDTVTILTNIAATAAHSSIHKNEGTVTEILCTIENGPESGKASNKGDVVTSTFTLRTVTTVPSAKPTDILTAPPIAVRGENDIRTVTLSSNNRGIARIVSGLRPGDHRVQIVPLAELFAAGDIDAGSISGGVGLGLHGGGYVFADCQVVSVTTPVAPVITAKPTPESLLPAVNTSIGTANAQPLPVEAPAPAPVPVSSGLFSNNTNTSSSLFGSRRNSRADSVTIGNNNNNDSLFDSNDRATPSMGGTTDGDNASMRDRMARLALAGRNGAAIPVIAQTEGGFSVQSIDASRTNTRSRSNTNATQGAVSSPSKDKDDYIATPQPTAVATTVPVTAPVQPTLGLHSLMRPPLGATNPTGGAPGNPALYGMGLGFNPLTGNALSTVGAYGQLGMMNALGLNNPLLNLNNTNNAVNAGAMATNGGNITVPGMDSVVEGVKELRNNTEGTTNILNRMDGKLDKLLASVKASNLVTPAPAPSQPQLSAKQLQLLQQQQMFGLSSTASTIVIGDNESEDNSTTDNFNDDMSVMSRTGGGSSSSSSAGTVVRIPDLLRQLTAVLNTASDAQRKIEEKTSKVNELRKDLTAARKDHDDALDTIDRLTATRAKLMREDTVLRNEKVELEEQIRTLTKQLAEAQARAEAGEEAAAASSTLAKQARLEVIQANEKLAEVQSALTASHELADTRKTALEASHNRIVELENALQGKHEEVAVSKEEKERLMHSVAAERASLLEEMSSKLTQANDEATKTLEEVRAIHLTEVQAAKTAGYKQGFAEGETKGYQQGLADGRREGYSEGHQKGRTEGHNMGYQEGLAAGNNGSVSETIPISSTDDTESSIPLPSVPTLPDLPDVTNVAPPDFVSEVATNENLPEILPTTDNATDRSVTKIQSVTRGYFDRKRSQALKLEKQRMLAEADAAARAAAEAQAAAQAAMEAAAKAEKEAQEAEAAAEAEKQRQNEAQQQQQQQSAVPILEPVVVAPSPPRQIDPQAHVKALAKFYEETRPEFANVTKATELYSKLGSKIWEMLGGKYGIEKVVKVAVEFDLVFPDDPIYAAITSAVETIRKSVIVESTPVVETAETEPESSDVSVPENSSAVGEENAEQSSSSFTNESVTVLSSTEVFDQEVKDAAVRIQAVFRGTLDRKRIVAMKAQLEAAELAIEAESKAASAHLAAITAQSFSDETSSSNSMSSNDVPYPPSVPAESGLFFSSSSNLWAAVDPPAVPSVEFTTDASSTSNSSTEFFPPPPPPPTMSLFASSYDDNDDSANVPPPVSSYEDTPTAPPPPSRSKLNHLFGGENNDDDEEEEEIDVFAVKKPASSLSSLFGSSVARSGGLFGTSTGNDEDEDNTEPPPPPEED